MPDAGSKPTAPWRSPFVLIVGGITLLALALRLPSLNDSLAGDELSTYFIVTGGHGPHNVLDYVRSSQEISPPLLFELAWATNALGHSVETLRLPSLLAGLGAVPLTYLVGERTVGRPAGIVGAALVALSPFMIFFSTEARAYMLVAFLLLCSTYALLRACESDGYWWWILYAAASCAVVYTHYTGLYVLAAQALWALVARPEARWRLILANLAAALAFVPWIPSLRDDGNVPGLDIIDVLHPFTFFNVRTDLVQWSLSSGTNGTTGIHQVPGVTATWLIGAGLAVGVVGLAWRVLQTREWRPSSGAVLVVLLGAATPIGAIIYSSVDVSVFLPRNLIGSWAYMALAGGALVTSATIRWLQAGAAALLVAGFAIGGFKMTDPDNQRPDFEAAASFIEQTGRPGDPVVELPQPTPSAQTPLEAQLAPYGEMVPRGHKVFDLTYGTLKGRLRERAPGGAGIFAPLRVIPPDVIARRAGKLGRGDKIFLVTPGTAPVSVMRQGALGTQVADFLSLLSPRFQLTETKVYPGYAGFTVTVNVFEDTRAGA